MSDSGDPAAVLQELQAQRPHGGQFAVELEKNVDVPENAVFFDSVLAGDTGSNGGSYTLPHAIAMYERDGGSLWQRTDPTTFDFMVSTAAPERTMVMFASAGSIPRDDRRASHSSGRFRRALPSR